MLTSEPYRQRCGLYILVFSRKNQDIYFTIFESNSFILVLEHQTLDLFGHMLFEKATIKAPLKKPHPMPNEACFLYILEGENHSVSELEQVSAYEGESVLMKCGHYLSHFLSNRENGHYQALAIHFYPEMPSM